MRNINCLSCNTPMKYCGTEKIQLGQTGWVLGDLPNLLSGALELEIYCCRECGKIEFYQPDGSTGENEIAKIKCRECGTMYDMDYPSCPFCKHKNY